MAASQVVGVDKECCRIVSGIAAPSAFKRTILALLAAALLLVPAASASATALPTTITENTTLVLAGNPYTGSPTIESGVTVKIEPGVKLTLGSLTVKGTLKAEGTAAEPVVFTSGAAEPKPGNWSYIRFEPGSGSSILNHAELAYGGSSETGGVEINASSPTIINSTIRKSKFAAINVPHGGSPEIAHDTFIENGLVFLGRAAISYYATPAEPGNVNIHDNTVEKGGYGISVSNTSTSGTGKSLGGNTVTGTWGSGLSYSGTDIPPDITENTLSGNEGGNNINVAGTVAHSATWSKGGSAISGSGDLTVASGVTLQMGPGIVFFPKKIVVKGTLRAEGTYKSPVIFTSGAKEAVPGDWNNIKFEPGSGESVLDYTEIAYGAGGEIGAVEINGASPKITHSLFRKNQAQAIKATAGGSPVIAYDAFIENGFYYLGRDAITYSATATATSSIHVHDNTIKKGGGGGINISNSSSGEVEVSNNTVEGCAGPGISVSQSSGTPGAGTLGGNVLVGNEGLGLSYSGTDIPGNITENFLSGNTTNRISISGTVAHSSTWGKGSAPISMGDVTIASGASLAIAPGVTMFPTGKITVKGTLKADGTAAEPIAFTSGAAEPKPGTWNYMKFEPGSGGSILDHVEIAYGGSSEIGAVEVNGSSPTITYTTFRKNQSSALRVPHGGSPEIAHNYFTGNGFYFLGRATVTYTATASEPGEVNIHDNIVEGGGGSGITVSNNSTAGAGGTLGSNTLIGNQGIGLSYSGVDVPGNITENSLVANENNVISVSGTVAHSSTWNDGGSRVDLSGEVVVAAGVTLKITPGVILTRPNIIVKGALKAEGTTSKPVSFVGSKLEAAGEWKRIVFEPGSGESVLDHVEVAYGGSVGGSGMIEVKGSHPIIRNSTVRKSANYGIKVIESGTPQISWNRFRGNANGLSYSGTGTLPATNNDWGCSSGPRPAGCGDSVTSNVSWKPPVQLQELDGPCRGKESQCGEGADPVSLASGHLDYSHRDLMLTNKSAVKLEFVRTYGSGSSADAGLGPGWSQTGLASVTELESGEVLVVRQDGRQDLFQKTESGYAPPSGVTDVLVKNEGTFRLTTLENTVYRFDASGRIASITDDHGLKTTYAYDTNGRLSTITDPSGQTLTFSYNASNHITLVKDSTGREVKFGYSAAGDLETVTDALGGVTKYGYDSQHRITSITDPRGNVILKNTYDSQGRIIEQRDGLENLWKLEYKTGETIVTEPQGGKLAYGFDGQNRVVSETDQLGHVTTTAYDVAGNVHEVVQPGGAKWTLDHDSVGNLTSVRDPEGGERKYEYDSKNRLTKFTDPRGNSWSYEWSAANDLTKIADPEGGETTLTYNESGQPMTITDPDKHKTELSYDTRGNRTSATDPLGHKASFEYNARNYLTSQTLPGLKAEGFERDALGDVLARTTPEGHKTKYAYDANGLPTQVTDPAEGIWKIERNGMERPTAYVDPLGQETKVSYNGNLRPTKVVNRRGKETTYAYDLANQLTEVARPESQIWKYGYDSRGNRTSMVDPRGNETTYEYDLLDRMTEAKEPLSVITKYGYDANGDVTGVTDPRGNATSYAYDKLGRLTEVAQPLEEKTTYTYDATGNELSKTTGVGALEYGYDAANRLTSIKAGEATLRSYGYDTANRLTEASDAEGHKVEVGYTEEGRPSSIKDGRGQSLTRSYDSRGNLVQEVDGRGTLEYGYDKLDRMTSLTDPQGKALGFAYDPEGDLTEATRPNGVTTTNVYNEAGRLAETSSRTAEPLTVLESLKYGYDAAGNVTSKVDQRLEQETSYAYDALGRLTEFNPPGEGTTTYGYDAAGNRTEAGGTTYAFNALNQLTESSAGTTYSYDGAGRLTGEANGSEETTFAWDPFDHLAKAETPGGTVTYAFDGLERMSERNSGEATQIFHYGDLGDMPTYETDGEGKTTTSYVQGPRGLVEQRSGEATSFPLLDGHGDVTAIASGGGEVESRQSFDPWGNQLSGPSLEMGYLGAWERPSDSTNGLIQMGARSYDPALGMFASEDPVLGHLGVGISANRYPYVWDNPVNRRDLNGRDVCVFGACAEDAAEDIEGAASDTWETGQYLVTHPREAATNAANYWAESESSAANIFGPLATLGDMGLNPDRVGYYLEKVSPAQMAATGIAAAGTVGTAGLTAVATDACFGVAAPLEALHTCTFVLGTGMTMTSAGAMATVEAARR